jgi:hypothetical protein
LVPWGLAIINFVPDQHTLSNTDFDGVKLVVYWGKSVSVVQRVNHT